MIFSSKRPIGARQRIAEIKRITDDRGIKSLARELMLFLLECLGRVETRADAQEQRMRIDRQPHHEMSSEDSEVEIIPNDDRRHAGASVMAGDLDAVGRGIKHALAFANRVV